VNNVVNVHQNCYLENESCQPDSVASLDEVQVCLVDINCVEVMIFVNCLILLGIIFLNSFVYCEESTC